MFCRGCGRPTGSWLHKDRFCPRCKEQLRKHVPAHEHMGNDDNYYQTYIVQPSVLSTAFGDSPTPYTPDPTPDFSFGGGATGGGGAGGSWDDGGSTSTDTSDSSSSDSGGGDSGGGGW